MSVFHNNALIGSGAGAGAAAVVVGPIKSLRFNGNGNDDGYLERSVSSASNRRTFTFAAWVKNDFKPGNDGRIFSAGTSPSNIFDITVSSSNEGSHLRVYNKTTTVHTNWNTANKLRDVAAWFHVVVGIDTTQATQANRVKVYINGVHITENGTTNTLPSQNAQMAVNDAVNHYIGRSGYYGGDRMAGYLADIYFIDGSQLDPTSFGAFDSNGVWQAAVYSGTYGTNGFHLLDFENESTVGHDSSGNENDFTAYNLTALNTFSTNMSPSDTAYPNTTLSNGGLTWSGNTSNDTGTVSSLAIPTNKKTYVEVYHASTGGGNPGPGVANGPTTEMGLDNIKAWWRGGTDGSVAASTLGSFTGTNTSWSNGDILGIALDNTANNGAGSITFYKNGTQIHTGGSGWTSYTDLRFEWQNNGTGTSSGTWNYGASSFSYPVSGHTGLFESTSLENVLVDVPTNGTQSDTGAGGEVSGNYATLNAVAPHGLTLSNGNLDGSGSVIQGHAPSTIFASSGKFYCEFTLTTYQNDTGVGVAASIANPDEDWIGEQAYMIGYLADGRIFQNSSSTSYSSYAAGDVIGVAFDADTGKVWFHKNGTYQNSGDPAAGTGQVGTITGGYALGFTFRSVGGAGSFNFGAKSFSYSAPTGFKTLCTTNLPTPTIADGSDHFDVLTWTGDGSGSRSFTGLSFQPDFTWVKIRSQSYSHTLFDSVRGAGSNKELSTDVRKLEGYANTAASGYLSSFDTNGFSSTEGSLDNDYFNKTGNTYVAWNWKGASSTTSNTDGSITTSIRANQTAGFSIVSFEGTGASSSIGHGLNAVPELVIVKDRESETGWPVWGPGFAANEWMALNNTNAKSTTDGSNYFPSAPTSSVVNLGPWTSPDEKELIAYCFAPVAGYSAFGTYTGNGSSSDGPFVYLGFRPAYILFRNTGSGQYWGVYDSARDTHNPAEKYLRAGASDAEGSGGSDHVDFLSNGFKVRSGFGFNNGSGATILYAAFAENAFSLNGGLAR